MGDSKQVVTELYNRTMNGTKVDRAFYASNGRSLTIDAAYFELLPVGTYTFKAVGGASAYEFTVKVTAVTETEIQDMTLESGCNAVIYLGNVEVKSVSVNGQTLTAEQYEIRNYTLTIDSSLLKKGDNSVAINDSIVITVTVV